ncbi:sensor histidine kinase [Flavobacterium sp. 3HN19-14]|uniref:sensor histidine kinase n=1 Tax=Flavobacterium sp. 3HN19-14 TaxID=3448133 RepID=UPI003EE096DC
MAGLIFVSLLAIGIFYNLKRNQKQKAIINEQKNLVEKQHAQISLSLTEKETLLREIHHRVKNNLQIISSLLNIQAQGIQDENVLSSLQEGQSRVQAMSLIHQNLYQSQFINNVNIENYLKDLIQYLSDIFRESDKKIAISIEASGIEFDIDTAIPLGLIVNELVSNACKYAFENRQTGNINIKIEHINDVDYKLCVSDDGKGLPEDFDAKNSTSLGLKLVKILSRQLRGVLSVTSANGLTVFSVQFKDLKAFLSN